MQAITKRRSAVYSGILIYRALKCTLGNLAL
jgi:hypothetical protein